MVIYSPVKISVNRGSDFSITCSIHSKYPEGVFSLTQSNGNATEMKPAFGHSVFYLAYFEFPAIDFINQGDYSCVYTVNLSSMSFISKPSKSIQVTVLGKNLLVFKQQLEPRFSLAITTKWSIPAYSIFIIIIGCHGSCGQSSGVANCAGYRLPGLEKEMARSW